MGTKMVAGVLGALLGLSLISARSVAQDSNDHCSPVDAVSDPNAACVKALTGCVCTVEGSVNQGAWGYCEGCFFNLSGSLHCSDGRVKHFSCSTSTDCGGAAQCGVTCPCTGQPFFPFTLTCGECTEF